MADTILIVGAHPDDVDFGASGTVMKSASQGDDVYYLICTMGDKGGTLNDLNPQELVQIRRREQKEAASSIGVKGVFFLDYHDGELTASKDLRREIVRVIRRVKPNKVFSFDPANQEFDGFHLFHSDHRAVAMSVFDAIYPAAKNRLYFPELLQEGLEPHKVQELYMFGTHKPNYWSDITCCIDEKIKCILRHDSQFNGKKAEMVAEYVRKSAEDAAKGQSFKYAEAFRTIVFPF